MASSRTPQLVMFAGPNGSGKSSMISMVRRHLPSIWSDPYINPDDIQKAIRESGELNLGSYQIDFSLENFAEFYREHSLQTDHQETLSKDFVTLDDSSPSDSTLVFSNPTFVSSYFVSLLADFIRQELLKKRSSFSFETVMSHHSKIELLKQAQKLGYRNHLYFVCLADPRVNVARVNNRVQLGGHDVPEDKIFERYYRSLELLHQAVPYTYRAYIYDNSSRTKLIVKIDKAAKLTIKSDTIPQWVDQYLLQKLL